MEMYMSCVAIGSEVKATTAAPLYPIGPLDIMEEPSRGRYTL